MDALLRLFKAVEIEEDTKVKDCPSEIIKLTLPKGFIFSPEVCGCYSNNQLKQLSEKIDVILPPEQLNNSFHKSWMKVKTASIEQLIVEQMIHYFTTYGFQRLGIYNEESIYIPNEELDIPEVNFDKLKLVVIRGYTKKEIKEKIKNLLSSGVALHEKTMSDIVSICIHIEFGLKDLSEVKNKEVRIQLYNLMNLTPRNPEEFLRYLVYLATDKTLLIKNKKTIDTIKECPNTVKNRIYYLLYQYDTTYGLENLSTIFYRFKPIFLAMKDPETARIINRIRKLASKNHVPMKSDLLNNLTNIIKQGKPINEGELLSELERVNIFRKIRLAYALQYRLSNADSILYKIRNGKSYATEFEFHEKELCKHCLNMVLRSIINSITEKVKDKVIFIPHDIQYTLPSTEKQFVGNFPSGTCVTVPRDMIFGIHWFNVHKRQIDLDLSLLTTDLVKFGWDGFYRDPHVSILFSGDMTSAPKPNGASELFYIERQNKIMYQLMQVNYYNYDQNLPVPFDIIIGSEELEELNKDHMIDPNNVICTVPNELNERQRILGLVETSPEQSKFYFIQSGFGKSITAVKNEHTKHAVHYLVNYVQNPIYLNTILRYAGAQVTFENGDGIDIDLSPEALEKDTIINLLT